MKKLLLKGLFVYATVRYPKIPKNLRYFIRDNYYCRLRQVKYLGKDYISKKPYKEIQFSGEFSPELTYALPFAYWHYLNGTLKKTISAKNMGVFYFFSPDHEERFSERIWQNSVGDFEFPNMMHSADFSYRKWAQVPLKKQYTNDIFRYNKPTLIIANKYNIEWDGPPLNYFSIEVLEKLITQLSDKYQIIYNRPPARQIVGDNSDILDLEEHAWMRTAHPEVLMMDDIFEAHQDKVKNFNHLQLMVYANCNRFISVHGGTAALASYFGGKNIILSKRGIEHAFNEFGTIFPALSSAEIHHAIDEDALFSRIPDFL